MKAELTGVNSTKASMLDLEPKLTFFQLDLSSLDSVEQFANNFLALNLPLHTLVLNVGVVKSPGAKFMGQAMQYGFDMTQDGFDIILVSITLDVFI
jgi:NAD(P)-dependent dehydrogenase (short-subunit alcohol dehydrogenase family)